MSDTTNITIPAISQIEEMWAPLAPFLFVPRNEAEYDRLAAFLRCLLDEVRSNETHPLVGLLTITGRLIEAYDDEKYPDFAKDE